jgi:hypothetical protein
MTAGSPGTGEAHEPRRKSMTQPSNEQLHRDELADDPAAPPAPEDALPEPAAKGHAKVPQGHHDEEYARAAERAEVEAGTRDYVPDDVPDAEPVDDLPADLAEDSDEV